MRIIIALTLICLSFIGISQNRQSITYTLEKADGENYLVVTDTAGQQTYMPLDSVVRLYVKTDSICVVNGSCVPLADDQVIEEFYRQDDVIYLTLEDGGEGTITLPTYSLNVNSFAQGFLSANNNELNFSSPDSSVLIYYEENSPEHIIKLETNWAKAPDSLGGSDDQEIWYFPTTGNLVLERGGSVNLNTLQFDSTYIYNALTDSIAASDGRDNDKDSANELQAIYISNDTIYLEQGGFVVLPQGVTPNLQQVTDQGQRTTNDLIVDGNGRIGMDSVHFINIEGLALLISAGEYNGVHTQSGQAVRQTMHRFGFWSVELSTPGIEGEGVVWTDRLEMNTFGELYHNDDLIATQPWVNANDDVDDADADPANELNNSFDLIGDTLRIVDAGGSLDVLIGDISGDNDPTNELQDLTLVGNDLGLTNSIPTVTLSDVALDNDYNSLDNLPTLYTGLWERPGSILYPQIAITNVAIGSATQLGGSRLSIDGLTTIKAQADVIGWGLNLTSENGNKTTKIQTMNDGDLRFRTDGVFTDLVALDDSTQQVGIGTASPLGKLNIKSAGNGTTALLITSGNNTNDMFKVAQGGSGNANMFFNRDDGVTGIKLASVGNSYFNGAYLGVGTTIPATKLHINDSADPTLRIQEGSTSGYFDLVHKSGSESEINFHGSTGSNTTLSINPYVVNGTENSFVNLFNNTNSNDGRFFIYSSDGTSNVAHAFRSQNYTEIDRYNNGLTIGTGVPEADLHVKGDVRIDDIGLNNSASKVVVINGSNDIQYREFSTFSTFDGLYNSLNFTGTTGLSDGIDNDDQLLSIAGHQLTSGTHTVTLPTSNVTTADMGFIRLTHSGTDNMNAAATDNIVPWNVQSDHNYTSIFSHTTATNNSRVEVLEDGNYLITGGVALSGVTANLRYNGRVKFRINGTTTLTHRFQPGYIRVTSGQDETNLVFSAIVTLDANDYVELLIDRENTTEGAANIIANQSTLNIALLKSATVTGSGGDNWGNQSVISDATLTGNGTSGSPLSAVQQTLSYDAPTDVISLTSGGSIDITEVNTNLSQEAVQDYVGSMVSGNTETRIAVTYDDANNEIDFVVDAPAWNDITDMPIDFSDGIDNVDDADNDPTNEIETWSTLGGIPAGFADGIDNVDDADNNPTNEIQSLSVASSTNGTIAISSGNTIDITELTEDQVGAMVTGNTETGINVTYDDAAGKLNYVVTSSSDGNNYPTSLGVTGSGTKTITMGRNGLSDLTANFTDNNTQLSQEAVQDYIGSMVSGNTETGIAVTYDDLGNELDFVVSPAWTSITGMPSGFADGVDDVNDADNNPANELQTISYNATTDQITLSNGGGTIDITEVNTDQQTLSISGQDLSINGGNTITLPSATDSDWLEIGTTLPPNDPADNIWRTGDVTIGDNANASGYRLNVVDNSADHIMRLRQNSGTKNSIYFDRPSLTDWVAGVNEVSGQSYFQINDGSTFTDPVFSISAFGAVGINKSNPGAELSIKKGTGNFGPMLFLESNINATTKSADVAFLISNNLDNAILSDIDWTAQSDDYPDFPSGTQTVSTSAAQIQIRKPYDDSTHAEMIFSVGLNKTPTTGSPYGGYGGERMRFLKNGGLNLKDYVTTASDVSQNVSARGTHEQDIVGVLMIEDNGDVVRQHLNQAYGDAIASSSVTYTLQEEDAYVFLAGSSPRTINLPESAELFQYKEVTIKCLTATQITLVPQGTALIENSGNSFTLISADPGVAITVMMVNPGSWHVIGSYHAN